MTVSTLPEGNTIIAKINAQPQGLEINKMTHMTVVGRYTDVSTGNQVIVAFDDFNRSKIASPRLTLAVIPETTDPSTSAVTSFQDMLKQNNWDYDWKTGTITLPNGKQLLINQIDNVTGQSFAEKISDATGALYVNKRPDGGIYFNPVIPYPAKALRDKAVSGYTIQNGQPVGLDLNNNPNIQASYDAGSDTWNWAEIKKEPKTLREAAQAIGFNIGTLMGGYFGPQYYREVTTIQQREFNLGQINVSWANDEPQQGNLNFSANDSDISLCRRADMKIMGHPLVWPADIPNWLSTNNFSPDQMKDILINRVKTVVGRYKGVVNVWSVVNEMYAPPYRPHDVFYNALGPSYVDIAFQAAREADPSAKLIYNDTLNHASRGHDSIMTQLTKTTVDRLKSKGLIDGVGLQMHLLGASPPDKQDVITTMKSYGLPVYVTEFDVNMKDVGGSQDQRFSKQADIYRNMMGAAIESSVCHDFVIFGINDGLSVWEKITSSPDYSPNADPLLFDDNFQPKPAYFAVMDAFKNAASNS